MPDKGYLDGDGLALLWERIKMLVYSCAGGGGGGGVTYRLESDGNQITLVGSNGSRSTVTVDAIAECDTIIK